MLPVDPSLLMMALILGIVVFVAFREIRVLSAQIGPMEEERSFFKEARLFVGVICFWFLVDMIFYILKQDSFYLLNAFFSMVWVLMVLFFSSPRLGFLAKKSREGLVVINQRRAKKFLVFWGITLLIGKVWLILSTP